MIIRFLARKAVHQAQQFRSYCQAPQLHFCVVGSGPAGFYSASKILNTFRSAAQVDILERLASPYGLVRSGVAPDHEDTKAVIKHFKRTAEQPGVRYFGGVRVGKHVSVTELLKLYHAVVLAYGAEDDWGLGIPGEDAGHVFSARQFVWWYNTHPDHKGLPVKLEDCASAVIVGNGNVALDCARVLLRSPSALEGTEIASHALQQLRRSSIQKVHIVARRGPLQAAFTAKEFRELTTLDNITVYVHPFLELTKEEEKLLKGDRITRRVVDLLLALQAEHRKQLRSQGKEDAAAGGKVNWREKQQQRKRGKESKPEEALSQEDARKKAAKLGYSVGSKSFDAGAALNKELHFHFYTQPTRLLQNPQGGVTGVAVEQTRLEYPTDGVAGRVVAVGTGEEHVLAADLVLKSVGYRGVPQPDVPFDAQRGTIPNQKGQVVMPPTPADPSTAPVPVPGLFVAGWLKRGANGIIGTNIVDAQDTVDSIAEWLDGDTMDSLPNKEGRAGLEALLRTRKVAYINYEQWRVVEKAEVENGKLRQKSREKYLSNRKMLEVGMGEAKEL